MWTKTNKPQEVQSGFNSINYRARIESDGLVEKK